MAAPSDYACAAPLLARYPDAFAREATAALADAHGVSPASVLVGNGSTEIFFWIVSALRPRRPAWISPTYAGYREVCQAAGIPGRSLLALDAGTGRLRCRQIPDVYCAKPGKK